MNRVLQLAAALAIAVSSAAAQGIDEYLRLRRLHKIERPVGVEALETMVGSRIIEVRGIVKGTFKVGDRASLMLERSDGDTEVIEAPALPDWLSGNEVPARLIVKAARSDEGGPLRATLLAAAPEHQIAAIDAEADRRRRSASHGKKPPLKSASRSAGPRGEWVAAPSEVVGIYASFIKRRNPRLPDDEALRIAHGIVGFSLKYGVDARLIMAMVMVESGFRPGVTSRAGAMGLGQLMPGTAAGLGVTNAYDSIQNLYGTVRLVRGHLDKYKKMTGRDFDSLVLMLAAYNAGPGAVRRHGGVPPYRETQNYVRKVYELYRQFCGR